MKKIIIKIEQKYFIIIYLNNKINENISPNELDKYLNQLLIEIDNEPLQEILNKFIYKISKTDIYQFLKQFKFDHSSGGGRFSFENKLIFRLCKKKEPLISINNISSIHGNSKQISKSQSKSLIKNIKYINTIMVLKPKNASFIIASMYSLSQIEEFAEYFLGNNVAFNNFPNLLLYFQEFINSLWIKGERYNPSNFIFFLKEKYNTKFNLREEKEPIVFLDVILEYLNSELNGEDKDVENELISLKYKFKNHDFLNFYLNIFVKKNNSIISKIFYGIFKETSICDQCGESSGFVTFNYIDLNITNYTNYQSELDNSLAYYYLDDLIEYFFNDENRNSKCKKCYKENKITKKIIKFPDVIIFRINWGRFSKDEGFKFDKKIEEEKQFLLEENKLIFNDTIDLSNYDVNNNKINYKVRTIINYSIINYSNKHDKSWKKYITFSRHLVDDLFYSYQPNGPTIKINNFNRKKFVPSVLFFEKFN